MSGGYLEACKRSSLRRSTVDAWATVSADFPSQQRRPALRLASIACLASKPAMTNEVNPVRMHVLPKEGHVDDTAPLRTWLAQLVERRGSDLLLIPDAPP